jgi:hypothetical protein
MIMVRKVRMIFNLPSTLLNRTQRAQSIFYYLCQWVSFGSVTNREMARITDIDERALFCLNKDNKAIMANCSFENWSIKDCGC